jgi:hypothetical protein
MSAVADRRTPAPAASTCPECGSTSRVLTCVTVPALGSAPRTVLVTRQCVATGCQFKFPTFSKEHDLTVEERAVWTRR